jgi:hypothetical protein
MSWITLTTDDVLRSLTESEHEAVQTAAVSAGQDDPLGAVITDVIREIRGYVAGNASNTLGTGATIPDELKGAALSRIRFEAFTRLPVGRALLTEDRVAANNSATQLLRDVAAGRFAIVQPVTPTTDVVGAPSPSIRERTRTFGRTSQEGL